MTDGLDRLEQALRDEFKTEVAFHSSIPSVLRAPSVVVTPGDPYLDPGTHGTVVERWDVLVVVSTIDSASGIKQMRDLSLRVRKAVTGVGALWRRASGPRLPSGTEQVKGLVLSVNQIEFRFDPGSSH